MRLTTEHHKGCHKAVLWTLGRTVLHQRSTYLNNRTEQHHKAVPQVSYRVQGFAICRILRFPRLGDRNEPTAYAQWQCCEVRRGAHAANHG